MVPKNVRSRVYFLRKFSSKMLRGNVSIFWDYEDVNIPQKITATYASNQITKSIRKECNDGIESKRLYYDSKKHPTLDRNNIDLAGWTLVDCPTRNGKETLDKKMIVDMMEYVYNQLRLGIKEFVVVLISSDGDYAYALNRFADLGVKTLLIHGSVKAQGQILFDSCTKSISFAEVLSLDLSSFEPFASPTPAALAARAPLPMAVAFSPSHPLVGPPPQDDVGGGRPGQPVIDREVSLESQLSDVTAESATGSLYDMYEELPRFESAESATSLSPDELAQYGMYQLICSCVKVNYGCGRRVIDGWSLDVQVRASYDRSHINNNYIRIRGFAVAEGLIQRGRRRHAETEIVPIDLSGNPPEGVLSTDLAPELYLCLTRSGDKVQEG